MSKKTSPQQEKYSSYELEVLAIVEALKKFRNYLMGNKFKIVTDCAAFQKTLNKKDLAPKVARWALLIDEYDYEIEHRAATRMKHVDALSRNTPDTKAVLIITRSQGEITKRIALAQKQDKSINEIKQLVENGSSKEYVIRNNILYKYSTGKEKLVVPDEMQREIIRKIHERGHFAASKTEEIVKQDFHIDGLKKKVEIVIANCIECILYNRKQGKAEGFLNPIPKEDRPLETYHIDHIGPLALTSKRYKYIFTVIDAFTKFTWFYPVKSLSAKEVIDKLELQQTIFGNPSRIISDKGTAFTGREFAEYCSKQGIEHLKITTGIPRGNGQVERLHRTMIPVLSKLTDGDECKWYKYVPKLQKIINSTVTRSTKYSPFELMTGVKMKDSDMQDIKRILEEEYIECMMEEREGIREEAKQNILKIQEENRTQFNKKRISPRKYKLGDLVAIKKTQFGNVAKLKEKYLGPYEITAIKNHDRYEVEKVGEHDGPGKTSTAAEYMKPWSTS